MPERSNSGHAAVPSEPLNAPGRAAINPDVGDAVERARQAQPAWQHTPLADRVVMLERFRQALFAQRAEVATIISRENGKPAAEAMMTEVATTLDMARFYARLAPAALGEQQLRSATLALWRKRIHITREPFGTVAVIAPWNYPFMLPAGIVLPALVAGNAVLLKPSEFAPSSAVQLAELLHAAGVPRDVLQVLPGDGQVGAALTASPVDKVFFTGSERTGRTVAHACAERLVPCALELGGSDPAIVLDDADVAHAASGIAWGRCTNAGQTCVAPKRVFVVGDAYQPLVAALTERLAALRLGMPGDRSYDVGPLIQHGQWRAVAALRDEAVSRGARAVAPGGAPPGTLHLAPTLLLEVPDEARALHEETFGPLLPVVRVQDEEEAIRRANASRFGLSASVWSRDRARARRVASRLEAGTVVINDVTLIAGVAEVPHGGVKASGHGRSHGALGLEECVRTRTIVDDRFTGWRQAWWFGYGPDAEARADAYVRLAHGRSLLERLRGIPRTLRLLLRPERPV
jgi:succinate-semialdehyde dehydrogenase/glutarate-semialdehyde dehydrogenase